MEKIKIKYHNKRVPRLEKIMVGDWIDLRVSENISMSAGDYCRIPLGISIKLPDHFEAWILPRGSTFENYGIIQTNSMGVVDNSYSGENDIWKMPVLAMRETTINEGDRVCQFRITHKMPEIMFEEVEFMEDEDRGGFGSTGKH